MWFPDRNRNKLTRSQLPWCHFQLEEWKLPTLQKAKRHPHVHQHIFKPSPTDPETTTIINKPTVIKKSLPVKWFSTKANNNTLKLWKNAGTKTQQWHSTKKHRQKREIGEGKLYGLIRHSTKMYRQHRQDILTVTRQTFFKGQKATQTV